MGLTRPRFNQLQESDFKSSCRVVTDSNITLSGGAPATVDGVNLQINDRVLVTAQIDATENGIYFVSALGSGANGTWTRTLDANENADISSGLILTVTEGTAWASSIWKLTTSDPITVGTTELVFVPNLENSNVYVKAIDIGDSLATIDSFSATGITTVRWLVSATDNVGGYHKTSTIDAVTDGATINEVEYGVLLSNNEQEVVTLGTTLAGGSIVLQGTGTSANVSVRVNRITLGSDTTTGYIRAQVLAAASSAVDLSAVDQNIIPAANVTYNLGSSSYRWNDIYLANSTIYLGEASISSQGEGLVLPNSVSIGSATLDASSGTLSLPSTITIGNSSISESAGTITLPANTAIGGATVATPRISSIDYPDNDTATDPAGGQTLGIVGSGFQSGASVILDGATIGVVTFVSDTRLEIVAPAKSAGSYTLYVINSDGGTGIFVPGVQYSGVPAWSTAAGNLGSQYETTNVSKTFSATSDSAVTYSLYSGTLPPGSSLNSSTGVLSGTADLTAGNPVTYNFTIRATDAEQQDTDRSFSLTIDPDVVGWLSPTDGSDITVVVDSASSTALSATSATGDTIDYTANALPTGLSLSGNIISGTATVIGNTSVALTATGNITTRSSTVTVNFVVELGGDLYFNQTVLLINADTDTFITDSSTNNFAITPNGDTRPSAFSPYNTSWSNFFDGNGDYLSVPSSEQLTLSTQNFTVEFWTNMSSGSSSYGRWIEQGAYTVNNTWRINRNADTDGVYFQIGSTSTRPQIVSSTTLTRGLWYHIALVRNNGTISLYINGVSEGTPITGNSTDFAANILYVGQGDGNYVAGHFSNLRIVKGTAVYTSNFTPATSPLTAISGTSLLTCQSNRFIDNSTNNFAITRNGDVKVTSFAPFTETDITTGSGYFDGTGDYLRTTSTLGVASNEFTIGFWFYPLSSSVVGLFDSGPGVVNCFRNFAANVIADQNTTPSVSFAGAYTVNAWNWMCITKSGTSFTVYINGTSVGTGTCSNPMAESNFTIGAINSGGDGSYNGYISNFIFVNNSSTVLSVPTSPLTAIANTSLLTLQNRISYDNSQPVDESGVKNIVTRVGNASVGSYTPHTPAGWSAYFDGTGDYLEIADNNALDLSGDFTIELWFYWVKRTGATFPRLMAKGDYQAAASAWRIDLVEADGYCGFAYGSTDVSTSFGTQTPNQWTHLAVTRSGSTLRTFRNGILQTTRNNVTQDFTSTYVLRIGAANALNVNELFCGNISNVCIVKGTALYTSNFTPSTTPLEPIANTSLLTLRGPGFTDDGPNRFAITRNGDTRITPFSPFKTHTIVPDSHSVFFDGTGDYLNTSYLSANFGTGDFTLEAWIYNTVRTDYNALFDTRSGATANPFVFGINTSGYLYYYNGAEYSASASGTIVPLNAWTHVAISRSGTTIKIFQNGVEILSRTDSNNLTGTSTGNITIGRVIQGLAHFFGYMSNLRIIKGTALYTSNFTPSTTPLTNVANTSLLTCQSSTVIDNSNNAFAITVNGNAQPTKFNPFGDTITTGVQYSPASHGGSYYFDGTGDTLSVSGTAVSFGTSAYTVEFWIYRTASPTTTRLLERGTNSTDFSIDLSTTGVLTINNNTTISGSTCSIAIPLNAWTHVSLSRNSTSTNDTRWFINGVLGGTFTHNVNITSGGTLWICSSFGSSLFLTGYLSGLRIINGTALYTSAFVPPAAPPTPVAGTTLLLNGTNAAIADAGGKNVLETVGNARIINGTKKYGTGSMSFDGTGDGLLVKNTSLQSFGTGDFTIECWMNTTTTSGTADLFGQLDSGSSAEPALIRNAGTLYWQTNYGVANLMNSAASGLFDGSWHHVAMVRYNGVSKVYLDGTSIMNANDTTNYNSVGDIGIGAIGATYGDYQGYIDDFRITAGIARYTANFTPPAATFLTN